MREIRIEAMDVGPGPNGKALHLHAEGFRHPVTIITHGDADGDTLEDLLNWLDMGGDTTLRFTGDNPDG